MKDEGETEGEFWRAVKAHKREERYRLGRDCPGCIQHHPKRNPTILMPQQRCRVCGHKDLRLPEVP